MTSPVLMSETTRFPVGTMVVINQGIYQDYVGRVEQYTHKWVWIHWMQDSESSNTFGHALINLQLCQQLTPLHPRALAYLSRGRLNPLCTAIIETLVAFVCEAKDPRLEMEAIIMDTKTRLAAQTYFEINSDDES